MSVQDKYSKNMVAKIIKLPGDFKKSIKIDETLYGDQPTFYLMGEIRIVLGINRGLRICGVSHPTRKPNLDELTRIRKAILSDAKAVVAFLEDFSDPNTVRLLELEIAILSNYVGISNQISKYMYDVIKLLLKDEYENEETTKSIAEAMRLYETYIAPDDIKEVEENADKKDTKDTKASSPQNTES